MTEPATESASRRCPRLELDASTGGALVGARRVVVLATSGSRSSIQATVFAADLACTLTAVLRIVHVVAPVEYKVGRLAPMLALRRRLSDPFESPVLRDARELAWRHGVAATLELRAGEPRQEIVAAAADAHAELLVIGARNEHRTFGRNAPTRRWIQAHARCRVLTPAAGGEAACPSAAPSIGCGTGPATSTARLSGHDFKSTGACKLEP